MHSAPHRARQARPTRPLSTSHSPGALDDPDLPRILRDACEGAGWSYAEAWVPDAEGVGLVLHPAWYGDHLAARFFRPPTEALAFTPGTGLPGRAARARELVVLPDITVDPQFCRPTAARKAGLRAGLAVPVVAGGKVVAVLAFFGRATPLAGDPMGALARDVATLLAARVAAPVGQPSTA